MTVPPEEIAQKVRQWAAAGGTARTMGEGACATALEQWLFACRYHENVT